MAISVQTAARTGLALALTALTAACGPARDAFAPACPVPAAVKPLQDVSRFRPGSKDLADLVVRAHVADIRGICRPGDDKSLVLAKVWVVVDAVRGPAFQGDSLDLPVFVAVTEGDVIRDKKIFAVKLEFGENVDTARGIGQEIEMALPVSLQKSAAAYGILAGFQLTPEELAAYRQSTPR